MLVSEVVLVRLAVLVLLLVAVAGIVVATPRIRARSSGDLVIGRGYCRPSDDVCDLISSGKLRGSTSACKFEIQFACGLTVAACQAGCASTSGCKGYVHSPTDNMNHCSGGVYHAPLSFSGTDPSGVSKCVWYIGEAEIIKTELAEWNKDCTCYALDGVESS